MEEDKIKINVLGCCVSRDVIDYKKEKYEVPRYAAFVSPWSMFSGRKVVVSDDELAKCNISNFRIRCLQHDANLSTIDYLKEKNSDWLLLDLGDTRLSVVDWARHNVLMSYTTGLKNTLQIFEEKLGKEHRIISCTDFPWCEFESRVRYLLDKILSFYQPEQIIFNELYCAYAFISRKNGYREWDYEYKWMDEQRKQFNPLFKKVYELCLKKLNGCHIIRWPENVIADELHRWGIYPLHYHNLYYEYAEKALDIITQKKERKTEELLLEHLQELYSEKFATLREKALCNNVRSDRDKWKDYSYTFKALAVKKMLLPNYEVSLTLASAILERGYKHIAIYGDTEITKVLCSVLVGTNVMIDYVVENAAKPISGIKTINRNPADYPDCDIMLVADIATWFDIKEKLEKIKAPFPFVNAAEFIQSLPTGESNSLDNIKKRINSLSEQLSASVKNEAKLTEQLNDLTKQDIASRKTIDKLNNDIKLMSDNKNKILAEKQKAASERDVALSELDAANSEIQAIRNSISFKVGRGLTLIPRKIRDFIKAKKK